MRVAVVKPDWGIVGGYELMLARIEAGLLARGHLVERYVVDARPARQRVRSLDIPPSVWERAPDLFGYVALADQLVATEMPAHRFDVVLSTQPPSFAVRHPRHLCLFSHHQRIYYDLAEVAVAAGRVDASIHDDAVATVRALDQKAFAGVTAFLACSQNVARRLATYNGISDRVRTFQGGPGLDVADGSGGSDQSDRSGRAEQPFVLCVTRQEFTKRAELFVHAMKYLPDHRGVVVGGGGRLPWLRALDATLSRPGTDLDAVTHHDLWLGPDHRPADPGEFRSNVDIRGTIGRDALTGLYRRAHCVVLPALDEDYGMTAVEAMKAGLPVVVCRDGGGLLELVTHEETGLIAEPEGASIAAAVRRLLDDPDEARRLGEAGRQAVAHITWDRAVDRVSEALELVGSG